MKSDMINFTIQSLRPLVLQEAVQYERTKFQQILDKQPGVCLLCLDSDPTDVLCLMDEGDSLTVIAFVYFFINIDFDNCHFQAPFFCHL